MRTFCMLKPDAFENEVIAEVLTRLKDAGFTVTQIQLRTMPQGQAELFYAEHKGKTHFANNIKFITSGPCLGLVLEKENAIKDLRKLIGNTDPQKAEKGTIRGDFGSELPKNIIHASDSEKSVEREVDVFVDFELKVLLGQLYGDLRVEENS